MTDVTRILSAIEQGDPRAAEQLLPLVYDELRKLAAQRLAQEKPGQTFQATALVHEAYVRLVDTDKEQQWDSRGHFFAAAAEAMRRILIDRAREKGREKRGGKLGRIDIDAIDLATTVTPDQLLAVDEALAKLASNDAVAAKIVELRYFAGLTVDEAGKAPAGGRPGHGTPPHADRPVQADPGGWRGRHGVRLDGPAGRAGPAPGGAEGHQARHGQPSGHRPLRGRAAGPGPHGPPQHRPRLRRRRDRRGPPLLRHGAGQGRAPHQVLRRAPHDAAR